MLLRRVHFFVLSLFPRRTNLTKFNRFGRRSVGLKGCRDVGLGCGGTFGCGDTLGRRSFVSPSSSSTSGISFLPYLHSRSTSPSPTLFKGQSRLVVLYNYRENKGQFTPAYWILILIPSSCIRVNIVLHFPLYFLNKKFHLSIFENHDCLQSL